MKRNTDTLHLDTNEAIAWLYHRAEQYPNDPLSKDIHKVVNRIRDSVPLRSTVISYNRANLILNDYLSGKLTPNFNKIIIRVRDDWKKTKFHSDVYGNRIS